MKRALAFANGHVQSRSHDVKVRVIWEFEVVDTSHDTGKVVIRSVWGFAWFANHGEHWGEALKA